jgi:acyl-CoA hydrolase
MNDFTRMKYIQKLRTADQVAGMVSSGDRIFFGEFVLRPDTLDEALARRAKQLSNVIIEGVCITTLPRFIEADPCREHFIYHDRHFSGGGRKLHQQGLCSYVPFTYHQGPRVVRKYKDYDFVFVTARPMDSQGYFNFGLCNSLTSAAITKGKRVVVEVNESLPHCLGGNQESVHISRVDYVVQGRNLPLLEVKPAVPADTDVRIARHIMNEIEDGACLQLGIGGLPKCDRVHDCGFRPQGPGCTHRDARGLHCGPL